MIITFLPINRKIEAKAGANLFQIARENEIDLGGICSGNKTCGKCKAIITKGNTKEFEEEELKKLTEEERNAGVRLTCCFSVVEDTCVIMPSSKTKEQSKDSAFNNKKTSANAHVNDHVKIDDENEVSYGIALDIGTTSVVAELWNLEEKKSLGTLSKQNPQSLYGADVISRITYANTDQDHLDKLTRLIRECCNKLIAELAINHKISTKAIISVVIAANTTMSHLFLGKSVETLAKVPFQGVSYQGEEWSASKFGITISSSGTVYVMPGVGGHVGSDTMGCILERKLAYSKGIQLVVDIGTNGEIVLAKEGRLIACSTAAGPAFEGAALHQGMRAVEGAISKVKIKDDEILVETIGDTKEKIDPIGICGSGVIEAVSELLQNDWMDETGRLLGSAGEENRVTLWKGVNSQVILTQKDIRELQLAKAAIYTGMLLLLREEQVTFKELNTLYLAGAFGSNINLNKAIQIGLLPDIELERIEYIGNAALKGAAMLLLGDISKQEAEQISKEVQHLELALNEDFQEEFIKAISFPEKTM